MASKVRPESSRAAFHDDAEGATREGESDMKSPLMKKIDSMQKCQMIWIGVTIVSLVIIIIVVIVVPLAVVLPQHTSNSDYATDVAVRPSAFGWTVMMQRIEQSSNFWQTTLSQYKTGFGLPGFDYWLGLDNVYNLMQSGSYKLRIEIQLQSDGKWYGVEYSSFVLVPDSGGSYQLSVSGLSGDTTQLGDPLLSTYSSLQTSYVSNGMVFSTSDYANPNAPSYNCAYNNQGGWWFSRCYYFCPTCNQNACYGCAGYPSWIAVRLLIKAVS